MDITEISFYLFIGISLIVYWCVPHKWRWGVLLLDSVIFCALNTAPQTFVYMFAGIVSVYGATVFFEKNPDSKAKKPVLVVTLLFVVGILAVLKYTSLVINTINYWSGQNIGTVSWKAPLAISFYTLTLISYLLDCYWGMSKAEKNILKLGLYIFYFPVMISGPILREGETKSKLFEEKTFDYDRTVKGMRRAAWGLLKKAVVADHLAMIVAYMAANLDLYKGLWVMAFIMIFSIELYFDFSGCMDIVIGMSACFGIELPENFTAPFLSKTIQEFWRRWHTTLGVWLKNYIMTPMLRTKWLTDMGVRCKKKFGKKGRKIPTYVAMFFVWSVMGIWHGNSWKYIIGEGWWFWIIIVLGQILEERFKKLKAFLHIKDDSKWYGAFCIVRTFIIYCFGNLFFKAQDLPTALYMVKNMFTKTYIHDPLAGLYDNVWTSFGGIQSVCVVGVLMIIQFLCDRKTYKGETMQTFVSALKTPVRWLLYFVLIMVIVEFGVFGKSAFIYFGF